MMYRHLVMLSAAVLVTLSQFGFRSKVSLFQKLQGNWTVDKVTYSLPSGDSIAQNQEAQFSFDGGDNPSEQHEGYYQLNGKSKYTFLYQLDGNGAPSAELILAVLSPPGQPLNRLSFFGSQPDFSSIWTVTELPGGIVKLSGQATLRRGGKEESVPAEIQLKK